jgi:two-component system CheB/CheR fusion protein
MRTHAVSVLERQSHQMATLLDDLLEASRVTQNKIELRRRVVDLRVVGTEAAEAVRAAMAERALHFTVDFDPHPVWVHGDPARLQQIQANLLNNAIKYTPRGGRVSLHVRNEPGGAVVRVTDNGAGIPPAMLHSVFELFVQSTHTLDRSGGGLGVGLTLVRALVEMHGGTVTALSDGDGAGSEFVVRLPLTVPSGMEDAQAVSPQTVSAAGAQVVVVEDNTDSREMLCMMLSREGFVCHAAASGAAALTLVDDVCPQIVILDVGLPEMDGFEVARRIRANPRHSSVHLIALTGYGQATDRHASTEAGFDYHIVKPVQPAQLLTLLAQLRGPTPRTSVRAQAPDQQITRSPNHQIPNLSPRPS